MPEMPENPAIALRETFLAEMSNRLLSEMSPFEVDETVREFRLHLQASAGAFEELGLEPVEAMRAAIHRFGKTEPIERGLVEESRRRPVRQSAPLCLGFGALYGALVLTAADSFACSTGLVGNTDPATLIIGTIMGFVIGMALHRRPRPPLQAGIRAGLLVPLWVMGSACLIYRALPELQYLFMSMAFFGMGAFLTGLLTQASVIALSRSATDRGRRQLPLR